MIFRLMRRFFCAHYWSLDLVFNAPPKTHIEKRQCIKCGKAETIFSGTREEWHAYLDEINAGPKG